MLRSAPAMQSVLHTRAKTRVCVSLYWVMCAHALVAVEQAASCWLPHLHRGCSSRSCLLDGRGYLAEPVQLVSEACQGGSQVPHARLKALNPRPGILDERQASGVRCVTSPSYDCPAIRLRLPLTSTVVPYYGMCYRCTPRTAVLHLTTACRSKTTILWAENVSTSRDATQPGACLQTAWFHLSKSQRGRQGSTHKGPIDGEAPE